MVSTDQQSLFKLQEQNLYSDLKRNRFTQIDMLETNTGWESLLQVSLWNQMLPLVWGEDIVQEWLGTCYWIQISLDDQIVVSYSINKHWFLSSADSWCSLTLASCWNEQSSSFQCHRMSPKLGNSVSMASNSHYGKANLSFSYPRFKLILFGHSLKLGYLKWGS